MSPSPSFLSQALTILKHKKPHESFTSYILDLQSKFTCSTESSVFHTSWRDYALNLERECADLKLKINSSETKLLALSNTVNLAGTTDTQPAMSSDPASKKKKMNASSGKRNGVSNLNCILAELADGREPAALFVALDHFAQLASLHELPDFPIDIFFSATRRVIRAASDSLNSILETNPNLNRLETLHDLMRFMIETSFLPLSSSESKSFGYLMFNQLSELLLLPVVHSFFPLSIKSLGYLLDDPSSTNLGKRKGTRQKDVDLRPKLLEFFQGIVSALFSAVCSLVKTTSGDGFCQDASSMRDTLILETIRHLKRILSPALVDKHTPDVTKDESKRYANHEKYRRVRRLAVKDAMWYLCSVFHILIGSRRPDANSDHKHKQRIGSEILEKTISRELFEILIDPRWCYHEKPWLSLATSQTLMDTRLIDRTDCHDSENGTEVVNGIMSNLHHVLDEAERGMLLCVIEHYVN